jgi:hypothetical protein
MKKQLLAAASVSAMLLLKSSALGSNLVSVEVHKTFPFAHTGTLKVQNVNGFIQISTWERNEVQMDAVKRGKTQGELDQIEIEIRAEEDRLEIATKYPERKLFGFRRSSSASVDYTLKIPKGAHLQEIANVNGKIELLGTPGPVVASTVNGGLEATGLASDAKLSSVNGAISASFQTLTGKQSIAVNTVNGALNLVLPSNASAKLNLETVNGSIRGDGNPKKNFPIGSELEEVLGSGEASLKANTVNGSIRLTIARPSAS